MLPEFEKVFTELEALRNEYFKTPEFNGEIHKRIEDDKWSIEEVLYHCYLLLKLTRQASEVYLPAGKIVLKLSPSKPKEYNGYMYNIYAGPTPMPAPRILIPKVNNDYSKGELRLMLERETEKMKQLVEKLTKDEAYWITYPDPVPNYPNVVQTVKLLKIHEAHHYNVLLKRERNGERTK